MAAQTTSCGDTSIHKLIVKEEKCYIEYINRLKRIGEQEWLADLLMNKLWVGYLIGIKAGGQKVRPAVLCCPLTEKIGVILMILDPQTLIVMLGLALLTQVVALLVQYKIGSRTYHGVGWWLLGISLMAVGVLFMPLVRVESLLFLAMTANPLMLLGKIFLFIAVLRFFDKKESRWMIASFYMIFMLFYYYFIFFNDDISSRTLVINGAMATVSFLAAFNLLTIKDRFVTGAASFTATIFLIYGGFLTTRFLWTIFIPPINTYLDDAFFLNAGFIVPTVISTLLTFGFILMANQRLNTEILLDKEKMHLIFNTSPDAAQIVRLSDGLLMDVNEGFTELFGYSRGEVLGISTMKINFWKDIEDRQAFLEKLKEQGRCENLEFVFQRKDGSEFFGMISAKIIEIQEVPHIVSVIRDISEGKVAEQHIKELVQQLETEKNTAQINSITDSMTGLANRRYFDISLKTEFYRLKRSGEPLSLIMLDVDQFKNFNDTYGHVAGDDCLIRIGRMLKEVVSRVPDIAARYGGEEFAVILPETESAGAKALGEKIRQGIEDLCVPHSASDVSEFVTVSLGVASVRTTDMVSPEQVVALADKALYRAKRKGRNRMEVADPQLEGGEIA